MKKLITLTALLAVAMNTHAASSWNWQSSREPLSGYTQDFAQNQFDATDTPYIPWYQLPDVGPLLTAATTAIENNDLDALKNVLSQAAELNLPYNAFDSFIARLQGTVHVNSIRKSTWDYKAIDNLLDDTLRTAHNRE